MKTTVVPAQITTVEDKIAGNLNFTQLLLLAVPVFLSGVFFAFLPPFMNFRGYKLFLCGMLTFVCIVLAIRIKGKIVMTWISIISRYNLRARYYIYNKNDSYLRPEPEQQKSLEKLPTKKAVKARPTVVVSLTELMQLESAVADPRAKFHFKTTKKGGLRVSIQEIK